MTTRERSLAMLAVLTIFVVVGGLIGYQFFYQPLRQKDKQARDLTEEIANKDFELEKLKIDMPRLDLMKKLSLPAKVEDASHLYTEELNKMLRDSEFAAGQFTVSPKQGENRTSGPQAKKPPFTKLVYEVTAQGELTNIVGFLDRFYRTPLLHRVRSLTINRPITSTTRQRQNVLDMMVSVEALIVDGAENRKTLLPDKAKVTPPPKLARTDTQYASIAGKDIFFGPPITRELPPQVQQTDELDPEEFISLDTITHNEAGSEASLWDAYNNRKYEIRRKGTSGTVEVELYYYIKDKKKTLQDRPSKELDIRTEKLESWASYKVLRIDATEIVIGSEEAYYKLHIGYKLSEAKKLTADEAKKLGLPSLKAAKPEVKKPATTDVKKPAATDGKKPVPDDDDDN